MTNSSAVTHSEANLQSTDVTKSVLSTPSTILLQEHNRKQETGTMCNGVMIVQSGAFSIFFFQLNRAQNELFN